MTTLLADLELARRLEEAEAFAAEAYARRFARRKPGADVAVEEVAGGRAVFAGAGSPLTEIKGVGLNGPVTEDDLDRLEAVVFRRGEAARVVVCPMADPSFVEGLGARGYRLAGFENVLVLPLGRDDPEPPASPGIAIRPVGPGEAEVYARVIAPNFAGPDGPVEDLVEMMVTMFGGDETTSFFALIDGEPVGGGGVLMRHGLALLAGAATLPPYRNRGVHAALHHARLALARRCGCDIAAQGALPGSTSQRNAERRGFRVAYTRAMMVREPS